MDHLPVARQDITGVILAGGRGSRLGGMDKGLVRLADRPLIEYVIDALRPQVGALLISANRNRDVYAAYGYPVIADVTGDYDGPLAGMHSAMRAAGTAYIVVVPCDTPRPPADLVERLEAALAAARADVAVVACEGRIQPVFALLRCALADGLQAYLAADERGVENWMRRQRPATAEFPDCSAFGNINTRDDLRRQETPA